MLIKGSFISILVEDEEWHSKYVDSHCLIITASASKHSLSTLTPRQNCRRFADDTLKRIFLKLNVRISITISLKFVPINNIPALVQVMAWRRPGDKLLSEPMMVSLLTHICVTRPQWVKYLNSLDLWGKTVHLYHTFSYLLTHCGRDEMATISQMIFWIYWMRMYGFWEIFHWRLFQSVQLTVFQQWFR